MKNADINIRDPFVLCENGRYYLYGTRAAGFGMRTGGFDVYVGADLENWSDPKPVFDSAACGVNGASNWAPEVHKFEGRYYMFATFEQKNGNRGTYSLVADSPTGPFVPLSDGALTPFDWYSLDGTLYVSPAGEPWLVFCHEHVQILNGTVCAVPLSRDLARAVGEPVLLFKGSDAYGVSYKEGERYVTDGPFLWRTGNGGLYMIWSTFIHGYAQCLAVSESGGVTGPWRQLPPLFTEDGGHGMLFRDLESGLRLTLHCPNRSLDERPVFFRAKEHAGGIEIEK
ncbi:MAG: family 43 glycosylhydrolase [Clostridia bacterium]|nr:family 43 glycosylhydrolase [Clostridia bacterium]